MIGINNFLVLTMLMISTGAHGVVNAVKIKNRLKQAFNHGSFVLPDNDELKQFKHVIESELAGQPVAESLESIGIQRFAEGDLVYFQEDSKKLTGRGLFAIREASNVNPWLIQAPHARSDKYTGSIVAQLFAEDKFRAAMWNSVPRKTRVINTANSTTADMAHLAGTYWQAMTEMFARQYADGKIIQIHGFDQSRRRSVAGKHSDIILSAGHYYPSQWVQSVARCLKELMPGKVSLYPYDVSELGATTNAQNHLLQQLGFKGFLHIELSHPMRRLLGKSRKLRKTMLECLG